MNRILLLLFVLTASVLCLDKAGPTNLFYSIPYYYGARVKDWNNTRSFYDDQPVTFFWSHNWNIDYRGNLWVADKMMHSIYYISKEYETFNAIFKVTGTEYEPGALDGNIAMGLFNQPMSLYVYDNNPNVRREQDHLRPVLFHDKFFELDMDDATRELKERCMIWVTEYNHTECGTLIPREFEEPTFTDEERAVMSQKEIDEIVRKAYL